MLFAAVFFRLNVLRKDPENDTVDDTERYRLFADPRCLRLYDTVRELECEDGLGAVKYDDIVKKI